MKIKMELIDLLSVLLGAKSNYKGEDTEPENVLNLEIK